MALSTQVMLLNLVILVDCYLFALDVFDGRDRYRFNVALPNPFEVNGIYYSAPIPITNNPFIEHLRHPYTSETTTTKKTPIYEVTTKAPPTTTQEPEEGEIETVSDIERRVFLMKNVQVPDDNDPEEEIPDEENIAPDVNSLMIEKDREIMGDFSLPDTNTEAPTTEANNEFSRKETEQDSTVDISSSLLPVIAVSPELLSSSSSGLAEKDTKITAPESVIPGNFVNYAENVNAAPSVPIPYSNNMNAVNNGATSTYTFVPFQNSPSQPNNYYLQPSSNNPQVFNIVPLNNYPAGNNQPNLVTLVTSQPNSFIPFNNQPSNLISINNPPNGYIPNNQPNNYVMNNPSNAIPLNNVPNNYVTNNQPTNFVPLNNQPNGYLPANNILVPINNNNPIPTNNQPLVLINGVLYNTQSVASTNPQPSNVVTYNTLPPTNNVPSNALPITNNVPNVITLNPNIPNNVLPVAPTNVPNQPNNAVTSNIIQNNGVNNIPTISFVPANNIPNKVTPLSPISNLPVAPLPSNINIPNNVASPESSSNVVSNTGTVSQDNDAPNRIASILSEKPILVNNVSDTKDKEGEDTLEIVSEEEGSNEEWDV